MPIPMTLPYNPFLSWLCRFPVDFVYLDFNGGHE